MADKRSKESIITIYDTGVDVKRLFKSIGIDILSARVLDNRTVYLDVNQLNLLYEKAPYLVAMATEIFQIYYRKILLTNIRKTGNNSCSGV